MGSGFPPSLRFRLRAKRSGATSTKLEERSRVGAARRSAEREAAAGLEEIRLKADATGCAIRDIAGHPGCDTLWSGFSRPMFKLITTMRRGSATSLAAAWARYPTVDAARLGTATLLRDDRILRVMIVRNEIPPAFVEWAER
ncbi:MAG: hypothetical protein DMF89_06550 [Acidobacteria bacterium]|nr:MAG: hypothetical protein DMF89_06550 [Acidobacteriota bacterium]